MSDEYVPEAFLSIIYWCPGCDPDRDPFDEILQVSYCTAHTPSTDGDMDAKAKTERTLGNSGMAEGSDCRAVQGFIR